MLPVFKGFTDGKVVFKKASNVPANPLYDGESNAAARSESDSTDVDSLPSAEAEKLKLERSLLRQLVLQDQRDFVIGSRDSPVQVAHLVPAFRRLANSKLGKDRHAAVRAALEDLLTELWFNGGQRFELDGFSNLLILNPEHHIALDLYCQIAFVPEMDALGRLFSRIFRDNTDWEERVEKDATARRDLNSLDYSITKWQVFVLRPDRFHTAGRPMHIVYPEKRYTSFTANGWQHINRGLDEWVPCHMAPAPDTQYNVLVRDDTGDPVLLSSPPRQAMEAQLSTFAMLTLLNSKLEEADRIAGRILLSSLRSKVRAIVGHIFFSPAKLRLGDKIKSILESQPLPSFGCSSAQTDTSPSAGLDLGLQSQLGALGYSGHGSSNSATAVEPENYSTVSTDSSDDPDDRRDPRDERSWEEWRAIFSQFSGSTGDDRVRVMNLLIGGPRSIDFPTGILINADEDVEN